jgi:Zn-dependent peptidase ImmA (M78 family)/transcriptional regulator with XRE-family HTH domain
VNPEILGARLRLGRQHAGLSQTEAAQAIDLTPAALNQYENGKRRVEALTLERLARLYAVPIGFFFTESKLEVEWEQALRAKAEALSPDGKIGVGRLIERVRALEVLFEKAGVEPPRPPRSPFAALPDREYGLDEVAEWAEQARRHFDLGIAPLTDVRTFLEKLGYRIFTVSLGGSKDDISGLFFIHPTLGPVIGVNADRAYTRRPYTMAHEFAHGLFHHENYPAILCRGNDDQAIEVFAERFAGQFLATKEAIYRVMWTMGAEHVTRPEEVVSIARYFSISYTAMLKRLRSEDKFKGNVKDFANVQPVRLAQKMGLNPSSLEFGERPLPLEDCMPPVALELAYKVINEERLTVGATAKLLGISETEMRDRLEINETEPESDEALYLYA